MGEKIYHNVKVDQIKENSREKAGREDVPQNTGAALSEAGAGGGEEERRKEDGTAEGCESRRVSLKASPFRNPGQAHSTPDHVRWKGSVPFRKFHYVDYTRELSQGFKVKENFPGPVFMILDFAPDLPNESINFTFVWRVSGITQSFRESILISDKLSDVFRKAEVWSVY
ncbi:hypothetical protein TNCV_2979901 [Trichonephila clavipes]|nr:hypothetical protein TNCV_2979901 [Trichonephila clavipes]